MSNNKITTIKPVTIRRVLNYLETELGLEIIGGFHTIDSKFAVIQYHHEMMTHDIDSLLALRRALSNGAVERDPE